AATAPGLGLPSHRSSSRATTGSSNSIADLVGPFSRFCCHSMPPTPVKPLNVWLVDDDASIRWVLEKALRQGGMLPTAFDHAETALAALRRERPDVLITDVRMPGKSGLDLLGEIRSSQPELPVIVMTA